ncbi:hypothetical protein HGRIS_001717 [Hohenbuehelia grisea]|uniref:Uncharacterized protein n=1 Tax=Hohenbuehelia grisea TaxID=104357 RepID=A0ABR3JIV9_9AGAR
MKIAASIAAPALLTLVTIGVRCLQLNVPSNPVSGAITDITWINQPNDHETWTLFLMNASYIWGLKGILATFVDPAPGIIQVTLPNLGAMDNLVLKAVNATNVDWVFATSPIFSVAAAPL